MELPEPIDLTAKLYRLKDCPDKLDADDQQFVNAMVDRLERGERPYRIQLLRIKDMQVPGEAPLVDPIWREGTVTALRKDLDQVIWRYMPLEQLFFLLSTGTLHFSPLCCMKDSSEGQLPKRAFEQTKAMLPPHFSQPGAAIDADTMTNLSIAYRQRDACISCWYMGTTQTTLPCGTNMRQELALRFEPLLAGCIRLLTDVMTQISIWLGSHTTNPMKRNDTSTTPTLDHSFIKHAEGFRHEKELRAVAYRTNDGRGVNIPVASNVLIESLVLSPDLPDLAVPFITQLIATLGFAGQIERSSAKSSRTAGLDAKSLIAGIRDGQVISSGWYEGNRSAKVRDATEAVIRKIQESDVVSE